MATQWFRSVFGFDEHGYQSTRGEFAMVDGPEGPNTILKCSNGRQFFVGPFTFSSVQELKDRVQASKATYEATKKQNKNSSSSSAAAPAASSTDSVSCVTTSNNSSKFKQQSPPETTTVVSSSDDPLASGCTFKQIVGIDIRSVHTNQESAGSVIQVASQLNALEMVGPGVTPNRGVAIYAQDPTQGPACALSCPAATVFRNYFSLSGKGQGGAPENQLNGVSDIERLVDNDKHKYWHLSNGYLMPNTTGAMLKLAQRIGPHSSELGRAIVNALRIGVHWSTEVECRTKHRVCQVFTSALPVGYNKSTPKGDWASFATLILEGAFTATLLVAGCLAYETGKRVKVFLCPIGGGAFENINGWIAYGMTKALFVCRDLPIDVMLANHSSVVQSHYKAVGIPKTEPWLPAVEKAPKETAST